MAIQVTTEPREERQLALTIEVSPDRVDRELRKAATKVAKQVRFPGFRQGKAPYHIVVQQYGLGNLYNEFVEDLGQTLFREALEQEGIAPYAQSSLENIELDPLRYTLIVPLEPEVALGDYRSLRLEPEEPTVQEDRVEQQLEMYRDQYAGWQDVERTSQYGDMLTIDVKSVIIPEEDVENAEETVVLDETDWDVTPDEENPMEPPGFDQELLGLRAGEEKEFVLGWPADGQSIYAGQQARFQVKVKNIQAYEKPELSDDFAKLVGPDYETLEDLKQSIRESIVSSEQNRLENEFVGKVLDALVDMSELNYPPVVIDDQIDAMLNDTEQRLRQLGIDSLETFLRQTNQSMDEYRERLRPEATRIARRNLILSEVVRAENLDVTDEEIETRIKQMVGIQEGDEMTESAEAVATMLRQGAGRTMIVSQALTEKAVGLLLAIVRGQEAPGTEPQAAIADPAPATVGDGPETAVEKAETALIADEETEAEDTETKTAE